MLMSYPLVGALASPGLHPASAQRRRTHCGPADAKTLWLQQHQHKEQQQLCVSKLSTRTRALMHARARAHTGASALLRPYKTISLQQLCKRRAALRQTIPWSGNQGVAGETPTPHSRPTPPTQDNSYLCFYTSRCDAKMKRGLRLTKTSEWTRFFSFFSHWTSCERRPREQKSDLSPRAASRSPL